MIRNLFAFICFLLISSTSFSHTENPVISAIEIDDIPGLIRALENGFSPDLRGDFGITPLIYSVNKGDIRIVKLLIKYGASVNATDIAGVSPLHIAARNGNQEIAKTLINAGAKVNAIDNYGMTPIMKATAANKGNMVKLLLSHGADPDTKDKLGYSASSMAKTSQNTAITQYIEEYKKQNIKVADKKSEVKVQTPAKEIENKSSDVKKAEVEFNADAAKSNLVVVTKPVVNKVEDTVDLAWLTPEQRKAEEAIIKSDKPATTIKSEKISSENKEEQKKDVVTEPKEKKEEEKVDPKKTHVVKTKSRKISVGRAKFVGGDVFTKYRITHIDESPKDDPYTKYWLIVKFDNKTYEYGTVLNKVIRQTQNYKVNYQAVENVKTKDKYIKIGLFNNSNTADIYCKRILADKFFDSCEVTKANIRNQNAAVNN